MSAISHLVVDVGDVPVRLSGTDPALIGLLEQRFARFLSHSTTPAFDFNLTVVRGSDTDVERDLTVRSSGDRWRLRRGDFEAEWSVRERRGWIRQTLSPYAVDSVLRIVHTLVLAGDGGFLLHASSAIREGRAFLFTGPSGSGKSTIVKVAPPDVVVLTDEISYVRADGDGYVAYGTPFAGELSDAGTPARAPIAALFRLEHAHENARTRLSRPAAVRTLMRNILFFADDPMLVEQVMDSACTFAARIPAFDLAFAPDSRVWETLQ
jgi:hypothetical protein